MVQVRGIVSRTAATLTAPIATVDIFFGMSRRLSGLYLSDQSSQIPSSLAGCHSRMARSREWRRTGNDQTVAPNDKPR
jgi:hypothetical protein